MNTGAKGDGPCTDVMEIYRPDDLGDIAVTMYEMNKYLAQHLT